MSKNKIEKIQSKHWEDKLKNYPNNLVEAVGSESIQHKTLRYEKIANIIQDDNYFSVLDIGSGTGDFYSYLEERFHDRKFKYTGVEVTESFHNIARNKYPEVDWKLLNILNDEIGAHDYVFMSGLFHQNGEVPKREWEVFFFEMLLKAYSIANKAVTFNALSDFADYQKEGNFYINLNGTIDFILNNLDRYFVVDYFTPLFEFTISVYNPKYVKTKYSEESFARYFSKQ